MPEAERIVTRLEKNMKENPYKGLPLKGKFKGFFRIRIGNYRVIYTKTQRGVLILRIGHRSKAYR
jgi:addiction module RelE/StbE family toxin